MDATIAGFIAALVVIGLLTMTQILTDSTAAEKVRYIISVVVLAGIFGWLLGLVSSAL